MPGGIVVRYGAIDTDHPEAYVSPLVHAQVPHGHEADLTS
jgi:hypothetical protein